MFVDNETVRIALCELECLTPGGGGTDWTFADACFAIDDDPGQTFELGFGLAGKAEGRDIITATTGMDRTFFFIGTEEETLARIEVARDETVRRKSPQKSRIPLRRK